MDSFIHVLQLAGSQDYSQVKLAEEQLKQWETTAGFYPKLLEIFAMRHLEVNIRWISIICLKNGVTKYWRRVAQNCLAEDEKVFIRDNILIFDESTPELALQVAVIIGKIARIDIKQWTKCLEKTVQAIKTSDELIQQRGLLVLNHIIKELASKRLASDRRVFEEISLRLFESLEELCYQNVNVFKSTHQQQQQDSSASRALDVAILTAKILRRILVYGGKGYEENSGQIRYLKWCIGQVPHFVSIVKNRAVGGGAKMKVERFAVLLMKTMSDFEDNHHASILPVLHDMLLLCLQYVMSNRGEGVSGTTESGDTDKLVIYSGNLLRSLCRRFTKLKEASPCTDMLLNTITVDNLNVLAHHVVMNYFPLTRTELDEWTNDPEGFVNTDAGESHKFLLRPCMETLYAGLFYGFKQHMVPFALQLIKETTNFNLAELTAVSGGEEQLLKVCAIFKAVGLASYELYEEIDFDAWFSTTLLDLFRLPSHDSRSYSIIQQHVLWMIGEWIDVKFSKANRLQLYDLVSAILIAKETDLVLKLTACKTLRIALDDFDFVLEDFERFVDGIFPALCGLLVEVEECDTKMMVLNLISLTIQRCGVNIQKHADVLVQYLPQLWDLSQHHNLLRGAVVNVLNYLVQGLGERSTQVANLTIPVLNHSTDVQQPAHIYLLEDGLDLWVSVMSHAPSLTPELLSTYANMFALFERASETLEICLNLTRSYLLLDARAFLQDYGKKLSQTLNELVGNLKESAVCSIAAILKLLAKIEPSVFFGDFQANLMFVFEGAVKDENYPPVMSKYFSVLSYLVVHQTESLYQVGQLYCQMNNVSYNEVMERLFDVWLDKMDCMQLEEKKVSAIAFALMLPTKTSFVMGRFALILDSCTNVLYELQRNSDQDEEENTVDSLIFDLSQEETGDEGGVRPSAEDVRNRKVMENDCIYKIVLLHFLKEKLQETKLSYGEQLFCQAMETMDPTVAKQLMTLIS